MAGNRPILLPHRKKNINENTIIDRSHVDYIKTNKSPVLDGTGKQKTAHGNPLYEADSTYIQQNRRDPYNMQSELRSGKLRFTLDKDNKINHMDPPPKHDIRWVGKEPHINFD
jgi:hypothetical protein